MRNSPTLEEQYQHDLQLLGFYKKRLLVPGWAGEINDAEAGYIAGELTRRPGLRRVWQVARFARYRKKVTPAVAKRLAMIWSQMPATAIGTAATDTVAPKDPATMRKTPQAKKWSSRVT